MQFDTTAAAPTLDVKTHSSHYKVLSDDLAQYAAWYKTGEQPQISDEAFYQADSYTIALTDFKARFGEPAARADVADWRDNVRGYFQSSK
jgi:hypothetical protein